MAKAKVTKQQTPGNESGNTDTGVDESYNSWKTFFGMSEKDNAEETYKILKRVIGDFNEARVGRQNSCYWYIAGDGDTAPNSTNRSTGGNWDKRREIQAKLFTMYYKPGGTDDLVSNVKSSMVTGRIEATLSKLKKINIEWVAKPTHPDDKGKAKIATLVINDVFKKTNAKQALTEVFLDALIYGTSFFRIYWQSKNRMVQFADTSAKGKTKEEKKQIIEDAKNKMLKSKWKDAEKITMEGLVIEPKEINSIYVDPIARCLHGDFYEARYIVERRITSYAAFYEEFKDDPDAINVDKVKAGKGFANFANNNNDFFLPPAEIIGMNSVEILEYENQYRDEYVVVVNGMLIKKIPLPQDCKELSYHKLDCITFPHQFYHIGMTDFLENTQSTQEILMNAIIQKIFESMNNRMFVDKSIYGEATQAMMREQTQFIPVDTSLSPGIRDKIVPMPYNPIGMDVFKTFEILERNATIASQVDPSQTSVVPDNTAATFGVMSQQQADTFISSLMDNFINTGLLYAGKQIWALAKQKYSVPEVKKLVGNDTDEKAEMTYKYLRLEGKKIVVDGKDINITDDDSDDYSFFQIKDTYLNTKEELDVEIAPDSVKVMNQGLEMQLAQQNFAQLLPFSVDPTRPQTYNMLKGPPLFNAVKLAEWYVEKNKLPEDILLQEDVNIGKEVIEAITETNQMLKGKTVPGIPGRSEEHILIHTASKNQIEAHVNDLKGQVDQVKSSIQPQIDPMSGQPIALPEMPSAVTKEIDMYMKVLTLLNTHTSTDEQPADATGQLSEQQPQPMQAPPMPGGLPQAGGVPMPPQQANTPNAMAGGNVSTLGLT